MIKIRSSPIFFSGIIILCLFIVSSYLKEELTQLKRLTRLEKKLYFDYQDIYHTISSQKLTKTPYRLISLKNTEIVKSVIHTIEESGFVVQALEPSPVQMSEGVDVLPIKMVLVGELYQLASLMNHLRFNHLNIGIRDFSLRVTEHHTVTMNWTMFILGAEFISSNTSSFSVDQLKWVGYLSNNQDCLALILLPDGKIKSVQVGDTIGMEGARVINITEDEVILRVGEQETHLRFLDRSAIRNIS